MVSLLPTKFHEILFSSFRGVALTNCDGQTDGQTDRQTGQKQYVSPPKWGGDINIWFSAVVNVSVIRMKFEN